MKILLVGPQGSGKSTQGKLLGEYLKLPYISTGDIFREISSEDSEEGRKIKQTIESGNLVDDQTTAKILQKRLEKSDFAGGFILDGYPRNLEQAQKIPNLIFDKVIYINVPEQVVMDRLLKRGRADDTEESIKKRLNLYFQQTQPLLDNYKNQGILVEVDGTGMLEDVQQKIREELNG